MIRFDRLLFLIAVFFIFLNEASSSESSSTTILESGYVIYAGTREASLSGTPAFHGAMRLQNPSGYLRFGLSVEAIYSSGDLFLDEEAYSHTGYGFGLSTGVSFHFFPSANSTPFVFIDGLAGRQIFQFLTPPPEEGYVSNSMYTGYTWGAGLDLQAGSSWSIRIKGTYREATTSVSTASDFSLRSTIIGLGLVFTP